MIKKRKHISAFVNKTFDTFVMTLRFSTRAETLINIKTRRFIQPFPQNQPDIHALTIFCSTTQKYNKTICKKILSRAVITSNQSLLK